MFCVHSVCVCGGRLIPPFHRFDLCHVPPPQPNITGECLSLSQDTSTEHCWVYKPNVVITAVVKADNAISSFFTKAAD